MWAKYSTPPHSVALLLLGLLIPQLLHDGKLGKSSPVALLEEETKAVQPDPIEQMVFEPAQTKLSKTELVKHWVCKLSPEANPEKIAQQLNAKFVRRLKGLAEYALFEITSSENQSKVRSLIGNIPEIQWHQEQIFRERFSKNVLTPSSITDPLFVHQWHLYNEQQDNSGNPGVDLNITGLWEEGFLGAGIRIAVVDDGLEYLHEDLAANYNATLSHDFQDRDSDPAPVFGSQFHGTAVGGLIGARDNGKFGVGIAPRSTLAGYRILGGSISDYMEAEAMGLNREVIHIYNNSWGPSDTDARYYSGPGPLYLEAIENSIVNGRGGLGNIYVWAGGNGGQNKDNSNYDGYANQPYTIAVTGVEKDGSNPSYAEPGANLFISAPGVSIVTTDLTGLRGDSLRDYVTDFGGTSAATGMISGAIALILQKNPNLSWRDVQHVLALTARQNDPSNSGWAFNGVGIPVHHNFGFGLIDTKAASDLAGTWIPMPDSSRVTLSKTVNQTLQNLPNTTLNSLILSSNTNRVEHVQVALTLQDYDWGELNVTLTSPDGTQSILAQPFSNGLGPESTTSTTTWTYMTVHNWGESANGTWTLTIQNETPGHTGKVVSWDLVLHTTADPNQQLPTSLGPNGETWQLFNTSSIAQTMNVLHNDAGQNWSILRISNPVNGTASFTPEGLISYKPNPNFSGLDLINYTVRDLQGREGRAQLQINVSNSSNSLETHLSFGGQDASIRLSPGSGEHILVSQPAQGSAEILDNNTLVYHSETGSYSEVMLHTQHTQDSVTYTTHAFLILNSPTGELARQLDGQDDRMVLYSSGQTNELSGPLTLEAWIYPDTFGAYISGGLNMGYARIFEKEILTLFLCNQSPITPSGSPYYQNQSLSLWLETQAGDVRYISTPENSIQLDTWQHVALSISIQGVVQIFINGQQQSLYSPGLSGTPGPLATNSQYQFYTGNNLDRTRGFQGKIDHIRHWSVQRTPQQIAQFYQFPVSGEESGLKSFWSMDDMINPVTASASHKIPDYEGTTITSPYLWQPHFLPDATPLAPNWWESPSLGVFNTSNGPWLWSVDHNFLFLASDSSQPLWFFDSQLEWIWTSVDHYPWIWSNNRQTWLYYQTNTHNPRSFYNPTSQDWTTDFDLGNQSPKF